MATTFYFNNRQVSLPGAYSTILSGETNPARNLDYGKVLVIDTGVLGAKFGGGAGINGELSKQQDAIYSFKSLAEFRNFQKGGMWWKIAEALFSPDPTNAAAVGISELYFARACTTTSSTMTFATEAGGTFAFQTRDEGVWANGVLEETVLASGYGYKIVPGTIDNTKYIMQVYCGTFTGMADDGLPYGEDYAINTIAKLVIQSPEFNNVQELIDWGKTNKSFNSMFKLDPTSEIAGTGAISETDITNLAGAYQLAEGGTETYGSSDVDAVLAEIADLDYTFVFTDQYGANANSPITRKVLTHLTTGSKFDHFLVAGTYGQAEDFQSALDLATAFNSERIIAVYNDSGLNSSLSGEGYRWWTVMYTVAAVVGRICGKAPYIPVTNKSIGVDRIRHSLSTQDQERALKAGLLTTIRNAYLKKFVILQGVNTLQDNEVLFNSNGQSYSIQFMRIIAQLNKELVVNAEIDLLGQENGVNANTLSAGVVRNWTIAYLKSRVATEDSDNLILAYQDVVVTKQEDAWFVTYKIRVNNEMNKLFFTGYLIR